ncbi:MAG: GNAT family N-acetyltransferase [Magnetococcales bacterium]|nr:GNAT family N-acetyltransferase [Magnetococcales bacterium]MBF0150526.1 GNAT family N-acetyltransferase [Magnetococcales bacterium]MBF0347185.1 GNAT family N-acetyltransferase [Magnetococcales bacterium]
MSRLAEPLSREDISSLADMHRDIGDSFTSALGPRFVQRYWRFIEKSHLESMFIHRDPGTRRITGCLVVSFDKPSLQSRVLLGTFPYSLFWLLVRFFSSPYLRRLLWAVGKKMLSSEEKDESPEIVFLYTTPEARNQKIAGTLLQQAEHHAMAQGFDVLYTQTVQTPTGKSIHFYNKYGYAAFRTSDLGVFRLIILKKKLDSQQ